MSEKEDKMMFPFQSVLRPILKLRIISFIFQVISIILSLIQPLLIGRLFDKINYTGNDSSFDSVIALSIILVIVSLLDFIIYFLKEYSFSKLLAKGANLMRENTLSSVLKLSLKSFEDKDKGDTLNKILNDSDLYASYAVSAIPQFIIIFIRVISIYIILFRMNAALTVIVITIFLIYLFLYFYINKHIRPHIQSERSTYSNVMTYAQETIDGFSTIKIDGKEAYFKKRFSSVLQQYLTTKIAVQRYVSLGNGLLNLFYAIIPVIVLSVGAYYVINNQITLGIVIAFYSYTHWIIDPVYSLSDLNKLRQQAKAVLPRLLELNTVEESDNKKIIEKIECLEIQNISFFYNETHEILRDLSLVLKPGMRIAITGESGIGKSTLAKLILGLMPPKKGLITANGMSLEKIDLKSYLCKCSYLPQDIFLFSDNLASNISFSSELDSWLEETISKCYLNNIFERSDFTIDKLSGGEKQRIALARAIYRKPSVLICDEPTSSLDENTEQAVIKTIDKYLKNHSCIFVVITHRKSLLNICDVELKLKGSGEFDIIYLQSAT